LLGRELIAYGSEIIYDVETQIESLTNPFYIDNAKFPELIALAFAIESKLDLNRPAYIDIKLGDTNKIYKPFSIKVKSGAVEFVNIDFVSGDKPIRLYQGIIKTILNYPQQAGDLIGLEYNSIRDWDEYAELGDSLNYSTYVKLSKRVLSDSVRVFCYDELVYPLSEFSFLRYDENAELYKVRTGSDGFVNVYFGDGLWGKQIKKDCKYQIFYLETTNFEYKPEMLTSDETFEIYGFGYAVDNDIKYARNQLKRALGANSVVATKEQIRKFVNSFADVIDSTVSVRALNNVDVYIKPTETTTTAFKDIEEELSLYGEIVTKYNVKRGNPLEFRIAMSALEGSIPDDVKNLAISKIEEELGYTQLKYVDVVNTRRVRDILTSLDIHKVDVSITIEEAIERILSLVPDKNSLTIVQDGEVAGWDSEGRLFILRNLFLNSGIQWTTLLGDVLISSDMETLMSTDGVMVSTVAFDSLKDLKLYNNGYYLVGIEKLIGNIKCYMLLNDDLFDKNSGFFAVRNNLSISNMLEFNLYEDFDECCIDKNGNLITLSRMSGNIYKMSVKAPFTDSAGSYFVSIQDYIHLSTQITIDSFLQISMFEHEGDIYCIFFNTFEGSFDVVVVTDYMENPSVLLNKTLDSKINISELRSLKYYKGKLIWVGNDASKTNYYITNIPKILGNLVLEDDDIIYEGKLLLDSNVFCNGNYIITIQDQKISILDMEGEELIVIESGGMAKTPVMSGFIFYKDKTIKSDLQLEGYRVIYKSSGTQSDDMTKYPVLKEVIWS